MGTKRWIQSTSAIDWSAALLPGSGNFGTSAAATALIVTPTAPTVITAPLERTLVVTADLQVTE